MEQVTQIVVSAVIVFAVIFLFTRIFFADYFDQARAVAAVETHITMAEPQLLITSRDIGGAYEYTLQLEADLQLTGELTEFGQRIPFVDVIPVVTYKEKDQKAKPFRVNDGENDYHKRIEVRLTSPRPPANVTNASSFSGVMKKYQSFVLEDADSMFIVELKAVETKGIEKLLCRDIAPDVPTPVGDVGITQRLCEATCYTDFRMICGDEIKETTLQGGCSGSHANCERIVKCKAGYVNLAVAAADCSKGMAVASISVEATSDRSFVPYAAGEPVDLNFFRRSECTEKNHDYASLRSKCQADYMGGPYTFYYIVKEL